MGETMVVAAPPENLPARKKRKSGASPDGVEQYSLEGLFALSDSLEPEALPASAIEEPPPSARPGQVRQLDFYVLADQEPGPGTWKPAVFGNVGAASRSAAPGRRKVKKSTALPEGVSQPALDELFVTTSPFAYQEPESPKTEEAYRPAPRRRNKAKKQTGLPSGMEQPTLEGFFALPGEAEVAPTQETRPAYGRPGQPEQHDFDALEYIPPEDGGAVPAAEPAGGGAGSDSAAVRRPAARSDGGE